MCSKPSSRTSLAAPAYCLQLSDFALQNGQVLAQLLDDARADVGILHALHDPGELLALLLEQLLVLAGLGLLFEHSPALGILTLPVRTLRLCPVPTRPA